MAYKTVQALTNDTLKAVGLVAGTSVQLYTEPSVQASIQTIFDMLFQKRFWDHLTDWHTFTLNGIDGLSTTDLNTFLAAHEDIEQVWTADFTHRIVRSFDTSHKLVNGAAPLYYEPIKYNAAASDPFVKKVIRIFPLTATGDVAIRCRSKPATFIPTDIVPFPSHIMAQAAAWNLLDSDGINPTAAAKAQAMFDMLYSDYVASLGEDVIGHGGGGMNVPLTIRTL